MRALYDYEAQGDDELALTVDGIIKLTPNGESYAEGWYEGKDSRGKQVCSTKTILMLIQSPNAPLFAFV